MPFLRFADMVKVAPDLMRLRADRSVYGAVKRFVQDDHLRQALSFHSLLVGGNPFETSAIYTLIHYLERNWGVFFPRGGTGALVRALVKLYEEIGGELRLSTPVRRIDAPNGHGRRPPRDDRTPARRSSTWWCRTPTCTTPTRSSTGRPARRGARAARLERMDWSMSLFLVYFGTEPPLPRTSRTTPSSSGRATRACSATSSTARRLPEDFSLYLHAPTVTDPSLAPPGCEAFYVLSPVPHLGLAKIDWEKAGPAYADRILALLEERLAPGLRASIVTRRIFTPVDFRDELNTFEGSAFSVAPKLTQSAWFRPHNRDPQDPRPLHRGRRHPPGGGHAGRRQLGQGHRPGDRGGPGAVKTGRRRARRSSRSTRRASPWPAASSRRGRARTRRRSTRGAA